MTNEQINRAIAEACGWSMEDGVWVWTANGIDCTYYELWDWANDLNAMHEAEKVLTDDQFKLYSHWVEKLMPETGFRFLLCATASQRAEAFVRSIGKWEATVKDCLMVGKEVQP